MNVGDVWYVWGKHQRVVEVRDGQRGQEVRLIPVGERQGNGRHYPWVEAWRVEKHGKPSAAYS